VSLQLDARQRAMLAEMGVQVWAPEAAVVSQHAAREIAGAAPRVNTAPKVVGSSPVVEHVARAHDAMDWNGLAVVAAQCKACGLCAGRTRTTLVAAAAARADWMVVGDPPGDEDDRAGQAFAGDAGVLLANMLRAVGAVRGEAAAAGTPAAHTAYATHVVKCRPPTGRVPQADELAQCSAFLDREIALVQPQVILAMGRFAIQSLLREHADTLSQPLGKQRGLVYRYRGIPVVVTYAPQQLLCNGADKARAWADLCLAAGLPTMAA